MAIRELPCGQRGVTEQMADAKEFTGSPSADIRPGGCKCQKCLPPPPGPCVDCGKCQAPCTKCKCNVG